MRQSALGTCQVDGCRERARYGIFRQVDGRKQWLHVCPKHERTIGDANEQRAKGVMPMKHN
jgi:hypothetical protein